jgi:predicted metal-dependent hydrolase
VLEGPWRALRSEFYHGLILYASAWVHWGRGNAHGVRAQLGKAAARLGPLPDAYLGLDLETIRTHCRVVVGLMERAPADRGPAEWARRIGPLALRYDPRAASGREPEWTVRG